MERGVMCPADCRFAIKRGVMLLLFQQVAVTTPLSIRRGVGGEAVFNYTFYTKNYDTKHCTQHFTQRQ